MFRLVKIINNNTTAETQLVPKKPNAFYTRGEALISMNGVATMPTATSSPDYIFISMNYNHNYDKINVQLVTEDSVFKVEYTGNVTPYKGMSVGLATHTLNMDAVTYNTSGKGTIMDIDDDKRFVYVRFRK